LLTKAKQGIYIAVDLSHYISCCWSNDVPFSKSESSGTGFPEFWINQNL